MIAFLAGVVRVLLVLLAVRLLGRFFAGLARSAATVPPVPPRRPPPSGVDLVRDRVCNTFLPRARAITGTVAGREEHFCSAACRDSALAGRA